MKDNKKKNIIAIDSSNQVEIGLYVDENIFYTMMQKEENLSSLQQLVQVKNTKIDSLFNLGSQENLIVGELANKLGLEVHDNPIPHPLGWVNKDVEIKVTKQ